MVFDHIADLARGASSIAELKGGAVEHHDYLFLVRKNVRKYSRIMELLRMKETLDKAKAKDAVDPRLDVPKSSTTLTAERRAAPSASLSSTLRVSASS